MVPDYKSAFLQNTSSDSDQEVGWPYFEKELNYVSILHEQENWCRLNNDPTLSYQWQSWFKHRSV